MESRLEGALLHAGHDVLPYVHNLFEHLACSDLALVQGGLSTRCWKIAPGPRLDDCKREST